MDTDFERKWRTRAYAQAEFTAFRRNLTDYREWDLVRERQRVRFQLQTGLPYGPCGLCAIHDFKRIGVESLKIVGREASPFKKARKACEWCGRIVDQVPGAGPRRSLSRCERAEIIARRS